MTEKLSLVEGLTCFVVPDTHVTYSVTVFILVALWSSLLMRVSFCISYHFLSLSTMYTGYVFE